MWMEGQIARELTLLVLTTPDGSVIEQSYMLGFRATNNEAEYEAVITGLRMAATF